MYREGIKLQINNLIQEGMEKVIICLYGEIGAIVKSILNQEFGIQEICIIDDVKCDNISIFSMDDFLGDFSIEGDEYVIIATTNEKLFFQKYCQLKGGAVCENRIKSIYENVRDYGYNHFLFEKRGFKFDSKIYRLNQDDTMFYLPYWDTDLIQSSIIIDDGYYEEKTLFYIMNKYVDRIKGKIVLDIGANIGNHSIFFAKYLNPKKVYAFEPVHPTYEILERNISINGLFDTIEPINCAIGNRHINGTCDKFDLHNIGGTSVSEKEDGEFGIITLDEKNFENISFIKIDVEGFEEKVLEGGLKTIERCHPILMIEIWEESGNFEKIYDILVKKMGYHMYAYDEANYIFE